MFSPIDLPLVARYAGGHNAGHTVIIRGKKFISAAGAVRRSST